MLRVNIKNKVLTLETEDYKKILVIGNYQYVLDSTGLKIIGVKTEIVLKWGSVTHLNGEPFTDDLDEIFEMILEKLDSTAGSGVFVQQFTAQFN